MSTIHGEKQEDMAAGLGEFLVHNQELHGSLMDWCDTNTNYPQVMKERYGPKPMSVTRAVELSDGPLNVSSLRILRKEVGEQIPSGYAVSQGRKEAEKAGAEICPMTTTPTSAQLDVGAVLGYAYGLGTQIKPTPIPFDATQISSSQSLLVGVRSMPLENPTEKLQSPDNVIYIYRGKGGDSKGEQYRDKTWTDISESRGLVPRTRY